MIIPHKDLNPDTLNSLILEFVSREGTDYGDHEVPMGEKISSVHLHLNKGNAVVVFDQETGSCNIVPIDQVVHH